MEQPSSIKVFINRKNWRILAQAIISGVFLLTAVCVCVNRDEKNHRDHPLCRASSLRGLCASAVFTPFAVYTFASFYNKSRKSFMTMKVEGVAAGMAIVQARG
jgi:hypothetical protein